MGLFSKFKEKKQNKQKSKNAVKPKVALVLGGGGARGFAHIGVLRALEEHGIDFDMCVGTSVGSLVGALYSAGVSASELTEMAEKLDLKDVHNGMILTPKDATKIGKIVTDIIGDALIESLPKKYCAVAVDLVTGKQVMFDSGKVGTAVSASCCVPVFFKPVVDGERHLVDGGLLNNIPADVAKMLGADKTVTIDINPTRGGGTESLATMDIIKATFGIMSANSSINGLQASDVLVAPIMSSFKSTKKAGYEQMIATGYEATIKQIDEIKKLISAEQE